MLWHVLFAVPMSLIGLAWDVLIVIYFIMQFTASLVVAINYVCKKLLPGTVLNQPIKYWQVVS